MKRLVFLLVVLAAACADTTPADVTPDEPNESTTLPVGVPSTGITERGIPAALEEFAFTTVSLDDEELFVALAESGAQRQQGLMNITDLGGLDGMLFVFDQDSSGGFWMKHTLIPLDIAFFDAEGKFVDGFVMEPCTTADCPTYRPSGSYRYALEMPAGDMHPDPQQLDLEDL